MCDGPLPEGRHGGIPRRYCSRQCKNKAAVAARKASPDYAERHRIAERDRYRRDPEKYALEHLTRLYGLSPEDYQKMLVEQDNRCAVCGKAETQTFRGRLRKLSVDYDHITRSVRGLLCSACNWMLGKSGDDPTTLEAGAAYLRRVRA